ncbi:MAG: hypothetical protein JWO38_6174 [Gemmataceae bacterium]|nr:hypothetical protein [Gemmataceae bacterium]
MIEREFQPVQGESILVSAKKAIRLIGLALVLIPVGVGLTWLWGSDTTIPLINKQVTWWGALVGGVVGAAGILLPPIVFWQWLVRKERLVIGTEYLQVVISKGGTDFVKKQIAFKNIESATLQKHFEQTVIAIQLRVVDAPDLVPPGGDTLTKFKRHFGFHLYLEDSYQLPAEDLCRRIEKAAAVRGPR